MKLLIDLVWVIKMIPDTVWAAVTASLLTLGGVLLQARNSRKLQIEMLRHDSQQREREREMSLKRDMFIPAADAVSRLQAALGSQCDLSIPDATISKTNQESLAALAKVQFVGGEKLVRAVTAYMMEHEATNVDIIFGRLALLDLKAQIAVLYQGVESALADQKRWVQEMQMANLDGSKSQQFWNVLNTNFKLATDQYTKNAEQHATLIKELQNGQVKLLQRAMEGMLALNKQITPLLLAAREELELSIDEQEYVRLGEDAQRRTLRLMGESISRLNELIERQHSRLEDSSTQQTKNN